MILDKHIQSLVREFERKGYVFITELEGVLYFNYENRVVTYTLD